MTHQPDWSGYRDLDPTRPGVVVAVVLDGAIDAWRSFGAAAPGGAELTPASVLYVGSVAKQFTAASIGLLVLDRELALDDDVRRYLPELPDRFDGVLIKHLLSHTSGLGDGHDLDRAAGCEVGRPFSTEERVGVVATAPLTDKPGTVHRYSNHGYVLLAAVVARVTDMCLGAFAAERVFAPLMMRCTGYLDTAHPVVVPGWSKGGRRVDIAFSCVGDGGLVTCIDDLVKWDRWLPSSPLAGLMLTTRSLLPNGRWAHDGWGISLRTHRGRRIESHGGTIDGYMASHVRFPELRASLIALANTDTIGIERFGESLRGVADSVLVDYLDPRLPPWSETHGIPMAERSTHS